jgi:hypothetical protein
MAIVRAVKSGNWSDPTVWNTGALPTAADDVYSNTFTVTIDVSPTVLQISNASTTGVTAGGGFLISANGITLTANTIASTATVLTVSNNTGTSVQLNGNHNGASAGAVGILFNGTGTLNMVGSIVPNILGSTTDTGGVRVSSSGTFNFTGNVSAVSNAEAIRLTSSGTVNVTGTVTAAIGSAIFSNGTGSISVVGSVNAGVAAGIGLTGAGSLTVNGTITASGSAAGVSSTSSAAQVLVTGPLLTSINGINPIYAIRWGWIASPSSTYYQVRVGGSGIIRSLYTADSVGGNPATSNVRSGTVYGPAGELTGTCAVPPAGSVALGVPVDATTGTAAIDGASIRAAVGLASANLDTQLDALPTAAEAATAVRSELATELGRIDDAVSSRLAPGGTLARVTLADTVTTLTNAPDVPTEAEIATAVRTELSTELGRLDVAISTRLATSSYTTPPTASAIATAVNSALDRTGFSLTSGERQAIATAVEQSILNENDGQAILNAIVGAIGNQNIDQVALVAAIRADLERTGGALATRSTLTAAQVRTELAPELGNLDATVSSRLPSSGYTAPPSAASIATTAWSAATRTLTANPGPSAADNATAVRAELSTELSRIDATVSSRLKPSDTLARVTLTDTATSLTNAPTVPTPGQIADEVRTELTPELSRVANCATTQEVGDIVQDALET